MLPLKPLILCHCLTITMKLIVFNYNDKKLKLGNCCCCCAHVYHTHFVITFVGGHK